MLIENRDWVNWQRTMSTGPEPAPNATGANRAPVTRPRPGHADLAGIAKYGRDDVRDILERASARETAARVAAGAIARQLLAAAGSASPATSSRSAASTFPKATTVSFAKPRRCQTTPLSTA